MSSQRVVVVSGSGSGIGAALVSRLTASGDRVIGVDRQGSPDIRADLATDDGRRSAIEEIGEACGGRLDALVSGAGLGTTHAAAEVISTNYFGAWGLIDGCREFLAAASGADRTSRAVAICSNSASCMPGIPDEAVDACLAGDEQGAGELVDDLYAYGVSKLALSRQLRRAAYGPDWAGAGICLNGVAPGSTETPLLEETKADPVVGPLFAAFPKPLGRNGEADEIAGAIEFLLSPPAAFMVGSILVIDGGVDAMLRADHWPVTF